MATEVSHQLRGEVASGRRSRAQAAWDDATLRNPHAVADKRRRVQRMFAAIAPSYDLNNRLHSLWMDQRWRRKAVQLSSVKSTEVVVDVACGTGDLTWAFYLEMDCQVHEQHLGMPWEGPAPHVLGV